MSQFISWIPAELAKVFPEADLGKGVDLDRDGVLSDLEKIQDTDNNGIVGNESDWQSFLQRNSARITSLEGFFKWGTSFRSDNPIHDLLSIESEVAKPEDVRQAYEKLSEILSTVRQYVRSNNLTPQGKLLVVYDAIRKGKIEFKKCVTLFTQGLKEGLADCDLSSFVVLAVAHEMGWPVYLVRVPEHMFVRWDDGKSIIFNMDFGRSHPNSWYVRRFNISEISRGNGSSQIYLTNISRSEMLALFFHNRGLAKAKLGDNRGVIEDYDRAIQLNPNDAGFYYNRGLAKSVFGDNRGAIEDYNQALQRDLNLVEVYYNRGVAKLAVGDDRGAIEDFDRAIQLDPNNARAYNNRGAARARLGDDRGAIEDFDWAIQLDPNNARAYNNRGAARARLGDNRGAIGDYDRAIQLNPNDAGFYRNRGIARAKLGNRSGAIEDFQKVLELNPEDHIARANLRRLRKRN